MTASKSLAGGSHDSNEVLMTSTGANDSKPTARQGGELFAKLNAGDLQAATGEG